MRRRNDWLQYLQILSEQSRDMAKHANVYASQWAHDVRCIRQGIEHRRVGSADLNASRDEWLQAGYVARQPVTNK